MMRFNPTVQYVPGKEQVVSDALSRKPLNTTNADDIELSSEVQAYVDAVESGWPTSPGRLEEIRRATEDDRELRAVADFVINGWPQRQDAVPASLYPYYHVQVRPVGSRRFTDLQRPHRHTRRIAIGDAEEAA